MQPARRTQTPIIPQPRSPRAGRAPQSFPRRPGAGGGVVSTLLILLAAPLIAFVLVTFVFQSYEVDGPSMETTLQHHDRLIVLKTGKTWAKLNNRSFMPARGEIVVFVRPDEGGRQLIKRVIALPGERVVVRGGGVTVFNDAFPDGFKPDQHAAWRDRVDPATAGELDLIVPAEHVFLLGDNRDNSLDSRVFGPVPAGDIVGVLAVRIFPFSAFEVFH